MLRMLIQTRKKRISMQGIDTILRKIVEHAASTKKKYNLCFMSERALNTVAHTETYVRLANFFSIIRELKQLRKFIDQNDQNVPAAS